MIFFPASGDNSNENSSVETRRRITRMKDKRGQLETSDADPTKAEVGIRM